MAWTTTNPTTVGAINTKENHDKLWDNVDYFKIEHTTDGTHKLSISKTPAADAWSGFTVSIVAHEQMALGSLCFINSDGEAALADVDAQATMPGIVMATAATSADTTGIFLVCGGVIHLHTLAPGWTKGSLVYAGSGATSAHTAGAISQGIPTGSGDQVQIVGVALDTDILLFQPNLILVEVA